MRVVIDIPQKLYKRIIETSPHWDTEIDKAIRNGIVLPEHHGRLIDSKVARDSIYKLLYESAMNNTGYVTDASDIFADIAENRLDIWVGLVPTVLEASK